MKIISNREIALTSTDVRGINNKEMRQMHELNNRIKAVLDSHKEGSEKREYVKDNDLRLMCAILSVFTKEFADTQTSAFDDFLNEEDKSVEDEPEVLIKGGPGAYPIMPIIGESKNF